MPRNPRKTNRQLRQLRLTENRNPKLTKYRVRSNLENVNANDRSRNTYPTCSLKIHTCPTPPHDRFSLPTPAARSICPCDDREPTTISTNYVQLIRTNLFVAVGSPVAQYALAKYAIQRIGDRSTRTATFFGDRKGRTTV